MRLASIETSFPKTLPSSFPVRLVQSPSSTTAILKLFVLLPASIALLTPFILVGIQLATTADARAVLFSHPQSGILLALALACWAVLLGLPIKSLVGSIARLRTVSIFNSSVQVSDSDVFGETKWRDSVQAFAGVAHNVRTSLSGVRHELVLVHRDPRKTVLLAMAPSFAQSDVDAICRLLNTLEVSPKLLHGMKGEVAGVSSVPQADRLRQAA